MNQPLNLPRRTLWTLVAAVLFVFTFTIYGRQWSAESPSLRQSHHSRHRHTLEDINNATLGFEKIFIIGLPARTDRRDGIVLGASLSNMDIELVDGVVGADIAEKAIPVGEDRKHITGAQAGCWRGHMNAMREIVRRNLSSALILEDDSDWDIRLRQQLHDFALSTHALIQPLAGSPIAYADPTFPRPVEGSPTSIPDLSFDNLPVTQPPTTSPYGDGWDMLWIGHCGMHFPFPNNKAMPKARIIRMNDETVAPKKNLWTFNKPFTLKEKYPEHTRAYHHAQEGVCSLGYAVSRRGAQKILQNLALMPPTDPYDILMRFFCEGSKGRSKNTCITTQPSLFHHFRMAGPNSAASDIGNHGDGFRKNSQTDMVRWSVRLNAEKLLNGDTNYTDQYPDGK